MNLESFPDRRQRRPMRDIALGIRAVSIASVALVITMATGGLSHAQESMRAGHHHGTGTEQTASTTTKSPKARKQRRDGVHHAHEEAHGTMPGMQHEGMSGMGTHGHDHSPDMQMKGFFGPYSITREGSGTSWVPDSTPHEGIHVMAEDWMLMAHGLFQWGRTIADFALCHPHEHAEAPASDGRIDEASYNIAAEFASRP